MKFISVVFLWCLIKGIENLPATTRPTTTQDFLNKAQQAVNSVPNSNAQVPKVSTPVGSTIINPPVIPTVQTTKAPTTTTTKAPTTTTKSTTTTSVPVTITTKAPVTTSTTTAAPIVTTAAPIITTAAPIITTATPIITITSPEATTGAPILTTVAFEATTKFPDIITTESPKNTTPLPETETTITSPDIITTAPYITTTLPATTETTTCEPTVHDDTPTTIPLSERLKEVLTQLLILLGELVKTRNGVDTSEPLYQLIIQLSDELHITNTSNDNNVGDNGNETENDGSSIIQNGGESGSTGSASSGSTGSTTSGSTSSTTSGSTGSTTNAEITINPDHIREILTQIQDIINHSSATEASDKINETIVQSMDILTEESEVKGTTNTGENTTDQNGEIDTSNDNKEDGTLNGQTGTSNEGKDPANGGDDTSNEEKDTTNTQAPSTDTELPTEGSGDAGSWDNQVTSNNSQIEQLLSRLITLLNDANESIDEVTRQLISLLLDILTEDSLDSSNTVTPITGTIAASEQINVLVKLLTTLLNQPIGIDNIEAINQSVKDLVKQLTSGDNTETEANSGNVDYPITFEIRVIVVQLEQLNNQPRTTAVNQKIGELIKQLEDQLIRTPTTNGTAWYQVIILLISNIKTVQTQPISTKTNKQIKDLLDELLRKLGNNPADSDEDLTTNYDDFMVLWKQRRDQREAQRKELAAIRAQKLADLAAQRRTQQQSFYDEVESLRLNYDDLTSSLQQRREQREAQRKELAAIRAQKIADLAAQRRIQQQNFNDEVQSLRLNYDDLTSSLQKRREQREAQRKELAAIRAEKFADLAAQKRIQQQSFNDEVESLRTNYDDLTTSLQQRRQQREAQRKEQAAIRAQKLADLAAQRKTQQQSFKDEVESLRTNYDDLTTSLQQRQQQREAQRKEQAAIRAQKLADAKTQRKTQQQSFKDEVDSLRTNYDDLTIGKLADQNKITQQNYGGPTVVPAVSTDQQVLKKADVADDLSSSITKLNQSLSSLLSSINLLSLF